MPSGKIKWYSDAKGFGFIEYNSSGDILFSRESYSGNAADLQEGRNVEFEIVEKDNGPVARNIVCK